MALRKSVQATARVPAPSALSGSGLIHAYGEYTTATATAADVVEMIPFPAHTKLVHFLAYIEDMDSDGTPAVTLDVGVLSGQYLAALNDAGSARTCGTELGSDVTTGQAGGSILGTAAQMLAIAPSLLDRSLGLKIEAAPDALVTTAKIRFFAVFAPVPQGVTVS